MTPDLTPLVNEGLSLREIAQETGLGLGAVRHRLRSQGLKTRNAQGGPSVNAGRPLALDEAETRAIVERARERQETRAETAKRERVDRATLRTAMRRYGVEWYR